MKISFITLLLSVIIALTLKGQPYGKHNANELVRDTIITAYEVENNDSTVYTAMQRIITGMQPVSYVSPLLLKFWPVERIVPLRYGEGRNGYILESLADQSFTLLQGRSQMDHFAQTSRVAFRYAPAIRLTMDNSSNILPTNQKIGIQIDKVLWDSFTKNLFTDRRTQRYQFVNDNSWLREPRGLHMLHTLLTAMHYSNGQPEGVYASMGDSIIGRNDYLKGDFSTNLVDLKLIYSFYNMYLFSAALGYQLDSDWGGPFSFIREQRQRYGTSRLTGFIQYRSRPLQNLLKKNVVVEDIYHKRSYLVKRLWEHRLRLDFEYILGLLSSFKRSKDYRFNTHFFYELNPLRSRTTGLMIHFYYGRDYLNIRYDDLVIAGMAGITFALNKYRHPRFDANKYILKENRNYKRKHG